MKYMRARAAISALAMVVALPLRGLPAANPDKDKVLSDGGKNEMSLRKQVDTFCRAFQIGDAGIIGDLWAEDGTLLDSAGETFKGRAAICKAYKDFFQEEGAQPIVVSIKSLTFPSPNLAVETGISSLPEGQTAAVSYTAVHIKQNGKWLIQSVVESPNALEGANSTLDELGWMAGNWTALGKDQSLALKAEWIGKQKFLRFLYFGDKNDGKIKGVKLVGWDPLRHRLITWHFSDDGGFGFGVVKKNGKDFQESVQSVQADGSRSSAIYIIKPQDKDSYSWQSTNRKLNGSPLPDTGVVQITRNQ